VGENVLLAALPVFENPALLEGNENRHNCIRTVPNKRTDPAPDGIERAEPTMHLQYTAYR